MNQQMIKPIRPGLMVGIFVLICGALWAAYVATHHQQLHGDFEAQQHALQEATAQHQRADLNMSAMNMTHEHGSNTSAGHHSGHNDDLRNNNGDQEAQHSHSGSLASDAMQRLLRGHIHAMGLGILVCVLLLIVAFTTLKNCWKKVFSFTFGLGALMYPPAWIIMGFRTVEMGPEAAEASIMWLFGPAVGLLLGSMVMLLCVLSIETFGLQKNKLLSRFFT